MKSGINDNCQSQESESGTKVIQLDYLSEDEKFEKQVSQTEETDLPLRRSTRQRKAPDFYGDRVTIAEKGNDPISFKDVLDSENKDQWVKAMNDEIESLKAHGVWKLLEPPKSSKIVGSKWVFKTKRDVNGGKARLVTQSAFWSGL